MRTHEARGSRAPKCTNSVVDYLKSHTMSRMSNLLLYTRHKLSQEPRCPQSTWPEHSVLRVAPREVELPSEGDPADTGPWPDGSEGSGLWLVSSSSWDQIISPWGGFLLKCVILEFPDSEWLLWRLVLLYIHVSCSHWWTGLYWWTGLDLVIQSRKPQPRLASPSAFDISLPFVLRAALNFLFSEDNLFSLFSDSWKHLHDTQSSPF